jgi:hypothetical protein
MSLPKLSREFLEEQLSKLTPISYNQYYWHRRYKTREVLSNKYPLYERIARGDFDVSDYYYQAEYEYYLMQDKLKLCNNADQEHEVRCLFMERRRKLIEDFEKEETTTLKKLKSEFCKIFKINVIALETIMNEFDGNLVDLYNHIKKLNNG